VWPARSWRNGDAPGAAIAPRLADGVREAVPHKIMGLGLGLRCFVFCRLSPPWPWWVLVGGGQPPSGVVRGGPWVIRRCRADVSPWLVRRSRFFPGGFPRRYVARSSRRGVSVLGLQKMAKEPLWVSTCSLVRSELTSATSRRVDAYVCAVRSSFRENLPSA
jgi:hypothetical protein